MSKEEEKYLEQGRREGGRRMAMELWRIFNGPYDRVNGDPKFIIGMESAAETCQAYAEMDNPLQYLEDLRAKGESNRTNPTQPR